MWIFSCPQKPNSLPNSKRIRLSNKAKTANRNASSDFSDSKNTSDFSDSKNTSDYSDSTNTSDYSDSTNTSDFSDSKNTPDFSDSKNPPYFYRWCPTCETFHSLDWFFNPDFRCFDIECFRRSEPRVGLRFREVPQASLPRDSRVLFAHMRQFYHKKSRFFSRLVRNEMPGASSADSNCCCLCQKPIDPPTDPTLDASPRSQLGPP